MKQKPSHQIQKCLSMAKKDPDVLAVLLFGSRTQKRSVHPESDIDLCLVLKPSAYTALVLSRKKIHYLELGGDLDIQIFQQLPLHLKQRILQAGKILYCSDQDALYHQAYLTIRQFSRLSLFYESYFKAVLHGR